MRKQTKLLKRITRINTHLLVLVDFQMDGYRNHLIEEKKVLKNKFKSQIK